MTVSMLNMYLERIPKYRNELIMDMSQATIYAQADSESRMKLWNGWLRTISIVDTKAIQDDAKGRGIHNNPITWNGQRMSIKGLIRKFAQTFGRSSVGRRGR